ncbi:MAG: alginate export family protein [Marinicellaceae bacterium]
MKKTLIILISFTFIAQASHVSAAENIMDSFKNGETNFSFRYRYELVDQDAFDRDANASTLRTRLNFKTESFKGFSLFAELDNVSEILSDNFNSGAGTSPDRSNFPVVADPDGTEINQAWINYNNSNTNFKLGRQRINLDNQRFIGGVGWRQNEQTFDAASFDVNLNDSRLFLSYVDQVNRIFGNDVPAGTHDNKTLISNWSKKWHDKHKIVLYYYDIENENVSAFSNATLGVSFDTHWQYENSKASLGFDFARQSDTANNPVDYSASYWRLDGEIKYANITYFIGHEVLEGDPNLEGASFRTPLATLHAFNGWSDQFLSTPSSGLEDTFFGLKGSINQFKWLIKYHEFKSESLNLDYGSELNASIAMKVNKKSSLLLKYAQFNSDEFSSDTNKLWFMFNYTF